MLRICSEIMWNITLLYFCLLIALCKCEWNRLMENPSLFEGDIVLNTEQKLMLNSYATSSKNSYNKHWPYGQPIPYQLDPKFESHEYKKKKIEGALRDYEKQTCLRFVKRTNKQTQKQFISFGPGRGCSSPVGMQYSGNYIQLSNGCFSHGTLLHEIAHSLGIWHEQNRPDRDNYIKINFENLKCCSSQFRKLTTTSIDSLGFPYDYESMMHYGTNAFGNYRGVVIEVLDKTKKIGQRRGFSKIDVAQINKMYRCGKTIPTKKVYTKPTVITSKPTTRKLITKRPVIKTKITQRQTNKPTQKPLNGYCIKHGTCGKYLNYGSDKKLSFSVSCKQRFLEVRNLSPIGSSQCASLENLQNGAYISLGAGCNDEFRRTKSSSLFSIQHIKSSKCIHANGGSMNPKEGAKAVMYTSCNRHGLYFTLEKE